jgi:hypothetical protein
MVDIARRKGFHDRVLPDQDPQKGGLLSAEYGKESLFTTRTPFIVSCKRECRAHTG